MAISTSLSGDQRTITLSYTANNAKVLAVLADAGQWLYSIQGLYQVPGLTWADLSNAQRLSIIDQAVRSQIIDWGKLYHREIELIAHQAAVNAVIDTLYEL